MASSSAAYVELGNHIGARARWCIPVSGFLVGAYIGQQHSKGASPRTTDSAILSMPTLLNSFVPYLVAKGYAAALRASADTFHTIENKLDASSRRSAVHQKFFEIIQETEYQVPGAQDRKQFKHLRPKEQVQIAREERERVEAGIVVLQVVPKKAMLNGGLTALLTGTGYVCGRVAGMYW